MDIQLPGMDGMQAFRYMRAEPETARDPGRSRVTAFAMKDDQERFLAAGFDGYVAKPLDIQDLPQQVAAACLQSARAKA